MKKMIISGLYWVFTAFAGVGLLAQQTSSNADDKDSDYWHSVYEENHVVEIDISLTKDAWESMEPKRQGRGRGSDAGFTYAKANLSIDGKPFEDAGLRFKGNSSYRFSAGGFKRPLKIDTNRFVKGLKLHGRTKLNLSNAFLDSAFMKEKLAYELYNAAGLATPGVGWAAVTLSIEGLQEKMDLGIYVLIEQVDDRYLARKFGEATKGSLLMKPEVSPNWEYPGEGAAAYKDFEIKAGEENEEQFRRFGELLKLINTGSDHAFAREIGARLDLKQFAGYLAATSILANIDSYIGMPHNYYLLLDKSDDKLRLLPWDVNEAFGTFTMGSSPEALVKWDINQPWVTNIRLIERLFETSQFRAFYRTALSNLLKNHFTAPKLFSRIAEFERAIVPYLKNDQVGKGVAGLRMGVEGDRSGYNSAVERRVFAIKPFITKRIESIGGQLAGTSQGERLIGRGRPGRGPGAGPPPGRR
jgi:spore coat protein H